VEVVITLNSSLMLRFMGILAFLSKTELPVSLILSKKDGYSAIKEIW